MNSPTTRNILCKILGHSYIALECQNWGKYYFGDGSGPHFLGQQVIKLWCQRCDHRIDDVKEAFTNE